MLRWFKKSEPDAPLAALCYGKLPIYKDFLKSRGGESSGMFQEWLNQLDRGEGKLARIPRTQRVLFVPRAGRSYVVATVWDSSDAGGVRKFPFALYFEPPRQRLAAQRERPVIQHRTLWERIENEHRSLAASRSTEEFYARLREITLGGEPGNDAAAAAAPADGAGVPARALAEAIFGAGALDDWVRLLWRLTLAVESGNGEDDPLKRCALRLPLGGGLPYHLQVESWLKFIRDRAGGDLPAPSIIWPLEGDADASSFVIAYREFSGGDARLLQEDRSGSNSLDFTAPDPEMPISGFSDFLPLAEKWLADPRADNWNLLPEGVRAGG